jgi:hypothetical protein
MIEKVCNEQGMQGVVTHQLTKKEGMMIPVVERSMEGKIMKEVGWPTFVGEFGEPKIKTLPEGTAGWRVVRLEIERTGDTAVRIFLLDADGKPARDRKAAFYWSDANQDSNCGPAGGVLPEMRSGRCIQGELKEDGAAHFTVGKGAYYFEPDIGPHAAWCYGQDEASEVILGLGMLGGSFHHHYNVVFQWTEGKPVTDESDQDGDKEKEKPSDSGSNEGTVVVEPGKCPEEMLAELDKLEKSISAIRDMLAQ